MGTLPIGAKLYAALEPDDQAQEHLIAVNRLPAIETRRDWVDYLALFVTALVMFLALPQLYLLKQTVNLTGISATAAQESALAARAAIEATETQFIAGQRAYLLTDVVDIVSGPVVPLVPMEFRVTVKNFGLTPALRVRTAGMIDLTAEPLQPPVSVGNGGSTANLGAGQSQVFPMFFKNRPDASLTKEAYDLLALEQTHRIRLAVRIDYEDVFGNRRSTTACYSYPTIVTTPFDPVNNSFMVDNGNCNQVN